MDKDVYSWNVCPIADTINVSAAQPRNFSNDRRIKKLAIELLSLFIKLTVYPETYTSHNRYSLNIGFRNVNNQRELFTRPLLHVVLAFQWLNNYNPLFDGRYYCVLFLCIFNGSLGKLNNKMCVKRKFLSFYFSWIFELYLGYRRNDNLIH